MPTSHLHITAGLAPHLRVDVHDRSRVEWVTTVPLAPPGEQHGYEVVFEADVPDAMWVPHHPWDHLQIRTRLTSPVLRPGRRLDGPAIDQLRLRALASAHELKLAPKAAQRIIQAVRRRDALLREDEADAIVGWLHQAMEKAQAARESFDYLRDADDPALEREQALADEYVSTHLLGLLTKVADALAGSRSTDRRPRPPLAGAADRVHAALRDLLHTEMAHRKQAGMRLCELRRPADIEAFLNRAALLKKHFQQALFLDARAYMLDQRLRNWIAAVVAMIASTFYFVWQISIINEAMSPGNTTVSLAMAGVIAGLVYAAKDRIKEVGRDWLAARLKHSYADRVVHLHLQERTDPQQSRLALARETIQVRKRWEADPLNPGLGRTTAVHHLRVREVLRHTGLLLLHKQGLNGLKHVFRYDLSPLFAKLDDHVKRVPVVDGDRVRAMGAQRRYAIPIRVAVRRIEGPEIPVVEQRGVLLVRRHGLERFVRADAGTPVLQLVPGRLPSRVGERGGHEQPTTSGDAAARARTAIG